MSRSLVFAAGALEAVVGEEDPRGMTESFGSPPGSRRRCLPAPPPSAHFPFPPREEEMVKDYTVAAGTSKGGSGSQR